jgi:hypothetical protein
MPFLLNDNKLLKYSKEEDENCLLNLRFNIEVLKD